MGAVIGIDPGGAHTGVIVRQGNRLLAHNVLPRAGKDLKTYCARVLYDAVEHYMQDHEPDVLIAVEGLNPPTPHMGVTSVGGLLDTATVLGAVLGWAACDPMNTWPRTVIVPPGRHGSGPLIAYPAQLRPTRGQGKGHDRLRHARSAWDVAGAAHTLHRITERTS